MTSLRRLKISDFRNLVAVDLECHHHLNLLCGVNGSGKTSVLEAIHVLATGKSFRVSQNDPLIAHDAEGFVLFVELGNGSAIGQTRQRSKSEALQLRLNGVSQRNWDEVAHLLPVLVLDTYTFKILEGGPKDRRRFMDWGVFHVEPEFLERWRSLQRSLGHRNQLLKQHEPDRQHLKVWDREFIAAAEGVDRCRRMYLEQLVPRIRETYRKLSGARGFELSVEYHRGWDSDWELSEALANSWPMERKYRATQVGPQRADISIKVDGKRALDVLSRGQLKLLVSALKIAQGELLQETNGRQCIYLIDDLISELDAENFSSVVSYLTATSNQLFLSCIHESDFQKSLGKAPEFTAFHVERGKIRND